VKCSTFRVLILSKSPPGTVLGVDPSRECELLPPFTRAWLAKQQDSRPRFPLSLVGPTTLRTGLAGLARRTHDGRQGGGRERASERASEAKCSFRVLIWSKSPPGRVLGVDPSRECELLPPFTRARVNLSLPVDHDDDVVQSTHPQSVCTAVAACRILPQGVEKKHDNV